MNKDIIKYIAIIIAIILLIWWLLINDNNINSVATEENIIEGTSIN